MKLLKYLKTLITLIFILLLFAIFSILSWHGQEQKLSIHNKGWELNFENTQSKAIKEDEDDPLYNGEKIVVSAIHTLKRVKKAKRVNSKGQTVNSTWLHFEETPIVRKMDEIFDLDGKKTRKAESLIGKKVFTTVWKPETYSAIEWWRNIYEAPAQHPTPQ